MKYYLRYTFYKYFSLYFDIFKSVLKVWVFSERNNPYWARLSSLSRLHYHTQTHQHSEGLLWTSVNPKQRPLPYNTQHSQETLPCPGGIRTYHPSKRAALTHSLHSAATGIGNSTINISKF